MFDDGLEFLISWDFKTLPVAQGNPSFHYFYLGFRCLISLWLLCFIDSEFRGNTLLLFLRSWKIFVLWAEAHFLLIYIWVTNLIFKLMFVSTQE